MEERDTIVVPMVFRRQDAGWEGCVLNYDIAVEGEDLTETVDLALRATTGYIDECLKEGKCVREMVRPVPLRFRLLAVWYALKDVFRR